MTSIDAMDQFDRLLAAGFSLPSGSDQASVFQEWQSAFVSVPVDDVAAGISRLITGRVDRFWPTIGELRGAIASVTSGRERTKCRLCHGSTWVEARPYTANGGYLYEGVRRCPECGVPPPKVDSHARGQQTPLTDREFDDWVNTTRPAVLVRTQAEFLARARQLAGLKVMPMVEPQTEPDSWA